MSYVDQVYFSIYTYVPSNVIQFFLYEGQSNLLMIVTIIYITYKRYLLIFYYYYNIRVLFVFCCIVFSVLVASYVKLMHFQHWLLICNVREVVEGMTAPKPFSWLAYLPWKRFYARATKCGSYTLTCNEFCMDYQFSFLKFK